MFECDPMVSKKIDVWSFGVVLWELIGRKWCFEQESYILIELSQKGKLEPPKFHFNHPLCDFITLCTIPSRIARPTSKIVFKILLELIETESVNFMMRSFTPTEVIGLNRQSAPPIPTGFDEDENAHRTNF
ncbi:unnamed protein product, partial [Mesorhabditis belari]|uniref:Protein kinase domain-containing protein n=1 Tax=Mesorhabditis belari TaxID=2138241 RepID=A0AAF3FP83_9BILA